MIYIYHSIVQGGVRARNELVLSIRNKEKKDTQILQSLNKGYYTI